MEFSRYLNPDYAKKAAKRVLAATVVIVAHIALSACEQNPGPSPMLISVPILPSQNSQKDCLPGASSGEPNFSPKEKEVALAKVEDLRSIFNRVINTQGVLHDLIPTDATEALDPNFDLKNTQRGSLYEQLVQLNGNPHTAQNTWGLSFMDKTNHHQQGFRVITSYPDCGNLYGATVGTLLNLNLLQAKLTNTVDAKDPQDKRIKETSLQQVIVQYLNIPEGATCAYGIDNVHYPLKAPAILVTGTYPDGSTIEAMLDTLGTLRALHKVAGAPEISINPQHIADVRRVIQAIRKDDVSYAQIRPIEEDDQHLKAEVTTLNDNPYLSSHFQVTDSYDNSGRMSGSLVETYLFDSVDGGKRASRDHLRGIVGQQISLPPITWTETTVPGNTQELVPAIEARGELPVGKFDIKADTAGFATITITPHTSQP